MVFVFGVIKAILRLIFRKFYAVKYDFCERYVTASIKRDNFGGGVWFEITEKLSPIYIVPEFRFTIPFSRIYCCLFKIVVIIYQFLLYNIFYY